MITERKYKESQAFALSAPDIAKFLKDAPPFAMERPPSDYTTTRQLMAKVYGGSSSQPLQVLKDASGETYRVACYPMYDLNSAMPLNPGESGLLYGREDIGEGKWSLFSRCPDRKEALWEYLGEYECKIVGTMTKEQFCAQKASVRFLIRASCFKLMITYVGPKPVGRTGMGEEERLLCFGKGEDHD